MFKKNTGFKKSTGIIVDVLRRSRWAAAIGCGCLIAACASDPTVAPSAASPAATSSGGSPGATTPGFSSRAVLESCVAEEKKLKARGDALKVMESKHQAMLLEAEASAQQMLKAQKKMDLQDPDQAAAFDAMIKVQNARNAVVNEDAQTANAASEAYNRSLKAYNNRCAANVYDIRDINAVKGAQSDANVQ